MRIKNLKPFLKWAGGKRWLVSRYSSLFPTTFNTYYEPFLGSAAVFFHLLPNKAVLADKNLDLIEAYRAIRTDYQGVLENLQHHARNHNEDYYYKLRNRLPKTSTSKAARFVYLNRTCFNGIYRVNKNGEFNVPRGTKNSVLFPDDDFGIVSKVLQNCELICDDFEAVVSRAKKGDFIYADPPYTVQHNNNNFIKYNELLFSWQDQERLAQALFQARDRGVMVIMSNADHLSIKALYRGFGKIIRVTRHSILAADSLKRKETTELIITNLG